mmetsp:Transcript_52340/g.84695  ORF Transcript_52340/g.84695 Transcript_52340/m.84695 type:complete len:321 (-) Transcript_52340:258-1220(-)
MFGDVSGSHGLTLNDGSQHPLVGFGTYKIGFVPASSNTADQPGHAPDQDPKEIIKDAIATGYRYIDCAQFYGNEAMVGRAIAECGVARSDLYIVSKVWGDKVYEGREAILAQLDQTLSDLQVKYLDAYLIHWPVPGKHVAAYQVLEEAHTAGKIKAIGLSNYTKEDFLELLPVLKVQPVVNQIEINPFLWRKNTFDFFMEQQIAIQSYRALRQGKEMEHPAIVAMATKYAKTAAQVLGRWCIQRKVIVVAKTVRKARMVENFNVFDFQLSDEEMGQLDSLTTDKSIDDFKALYFKCVVRDTPLEALPLSDQGLKAVITHN